MIELTNARGHVLRVDGGDAGQVKFWNDLGYAGGDASDAGSKGYDGLKVDELKAEIERRNEGRDDADLLSSDGKKADLIAALEADDNK